MKKVHCKGVSWCVLESECGFIRTKGLCTLILNSSQKWKSRWTTFYDFIVNYLKKEKSCKEEYRNWNLLASYTQDPYSHKSGTGSGESVDAEPREDMCDRWEEGREKQQTVQGAATEQSWEEQRECGWRRKAEQEAEKGRKEC